MYPWANSVVSETLTGLDRLWTIMVLCEGLDSWWNLGEAATGFDVGFVGCWFAGLDASGVPVF